MIKNLSNSIRAKGTVIAIGIMFLACVISFGFMTALFMAVHYNDNLSIAEAHELFRYYMIATLILCIVLGSSLLYLAIRKVSEPIIRISNATKEVAKGDFSIKIDYLSNDEIGVLAKNFNKMTTELGNMEYLRKDFISNVSHELKTPVASIQGFAEMLQNKNLSEENVHVYTTIIIEETKRLSNLSANMLRLSMLDHQSIPESGKLFSLDEQIRRAIVLLEEKWTKRNLELAIDLEKIDYTGDDSLTQQIWLNIIDNAIKFSRDSGTISIQAKKTADVVVVRIQDQGMGISDVDQERIFEKFYQADKSHSQEGSGLGLAIVKRIVEIHGGDIDFTSKVGQGTTFIITLPLPLE
ncbi:sensor histidine kinase [Desulfuribacillus alkaliarsenatis]|uniref:Heme sensor protein HssS n=1 Tax=Desulfuribacillus alkaliarsenatis TaxID=766136 RepID=A0A1E5G0V9_9FIRM|nr:HAMP domain-containing sensor histidine kinase [Desulfuribacillus alkaliarsenatis]OEF96552.1 two-component sensor histidine kinase [Desulfuribacillus alkaliarsenatis]